MSSADVLIDMCPIEYADAQATWGGGLNKESSEFIKTMRECGEQIIAVVGVTDVSVVPKHLTIWCNLVTTGVHRKDQTPERVFAGFAEYLKANGYLST